jgi:hypothetical protein
VSGLASGSVGDPLRDGVPVPDPGPFHAHWTADPAVIDRARRLLAEHSAPADEASAPEGAQRKLPSPGYVLGVELRQRQRDMADWQERDFINREFQRQARLVRRFAPVLKLMVESAEGQAARIHCTDPTDDEWKARWEAADPWGFMLWQEACAVLAKVGQ